MLYDLGFLIFSLIYLPVLIFKGKLHASFLERFAVFGREKKRALLSGKSRIWVQAVSVGEVALCKNLIPQLKKRYPAHDIVISTITKAGNDLAKKIFSKDAIIIYFPLDFSFIVRKAVGIIRPGLYIMIETEIWPNLLKVLSSGSVPAILLNGRISDRSIPGYRLARPFLKNTLGRISAFCMQDKIDAGRIIELGAPPDRVSITGNMKFDMEGAVSAGKPQVMRQLVGLGERDDLLVAGSTHPGEEEIVIAAYKELSAEFPNLKLLIAPRHINRAGDIERIIRKSGFEPVRFSMLSPEYDERRTTNDPVPVAPSELRYGAGERRITILDTIGRLNEVYLAATLVFIGGSFVRHGGQNPIEPAALEKAVLFGPYMFNFRYIVKVFLNNGAAVEVRDKKDFIEKCRALLKDECSRSELGRNAKRVAMENRGATEKNLEAMGRIFK